MKAQCASLTLYHSQRISLHVARPPLVALALLAVATAVNAQRSEASAYTDATLMQLHSIPEPGV